MLDKHMATYRPLQEEDIPTLYQWHQLPHVVQWWDPPAAYEDFYEYRMQCIKGLDPVHSFTLVYANQPIGYLQMYAASEEFLACIGVTEQAAILDLFIGDVNYLHHGLGPFLLRRFLKEQVFAEPAFESCLIGPDPANEAAIKAYLKVGFEHLKTVTIPSLNEVQYVMRVLPATLKDE